MFDSLQFTMSLVVDGGWGAWSAVGLCSSSCGGGKKVRTRKCDNPTPRNGGASCRGPTSDSLDCPQVPCEGIQYK